MTKKITSKQKKEQLNQLFAAYNRRLGMLYSGYVKKLLSLGYGEDVLESDALFNFDNFPELKARLNEIFNDYFQNNMLCYKSGITDGVTLAYAHDNDALGQFSTLTDKALETARKTAAASFFANRLNVKNGLNLAQSVWNYCQQTKAEFEMAMSNVIADGLGKGTSAEEVGKRIRQYLNNPDMMYRRYHTVKVLKNGQKKDVVTWRKRRIIDGRVRFVEEPLEHVGQGVYRSARKNALRVARTEINAAYHNARNERWANEPFVIGQYIHLSPQHDPEKDEDICDELQGYYPKDFKWSGWHPNCMCTSDPIMVYGEERKALIRRLMNGEDISDYVSPNRVKDVPEQYRRYIETNSEKIVSAFKRDKLAWHLANNKSYWVKYLSASERKQIGRNAMSHRETIQDIAKARHEKRDAAKIQKNWTLRRSAMYMERMNEVIGHLSYSDYSTMGKALQKRYYDVTSALKSNKTWDINNMERLFKRFKQGVSIRERWDKLLWGGFSPEQIANCRELEKKFGIFKGRPMSIELADKQSANPFFNLGKEWQVNCATCSPAYVLREMGFNIFAKGNPEKRGNLNYWISKQHSFDTWKNADGSKPQPLNTYQWMQSKKYKQMTPQRYAEYIDEATRNEGTYIITIAWKGNKGGHATILKRLGNGKVVYIEPQLYLKEKGTTRDIMELCNEGARSWTSVYYKGIMRVDDKLFDPQYADIFTRMN